ncbi:uncharacterized protein PAC_07508 [Phialocephala subalpina]|uniref:SET domain-containing protein n=1 Tax=Phialocephala subalpina TaxID=576137 RepID=A0A1L7WXW6_9HELO|nr:uncharacterized protein PAC_07508 [Phialocephala subalpina]
MSSSSMDTVNSCELSPEQHEVIYEDSLGLEGQTPPKQVKEDLLRVHTRNLDLAKKSKYLRKDFVLPAAYSPCTASLDTLQKVCYPYYAVRYNTESNQISLFDLRLGTHHRGCFITARTITSSYLSTSLITILEDDTGTVARLIQAYQLPFTSFTKSSIPINSTIAIKEPCCQFNGKDDWVIRVDHPSDIAVLGGDDEAVAMIVEFADGGKEISAMKWKEAGDRAYLGGKFLSAVECYTQAIDNSASDQAFQKAVLRKRAFANLTAKCFQVAKGDVLASCSDDHEPSDEKAYFCAGRAAYELGLYTESKQHFEKALQLKPSDLKTQKELQRVQTRTLESEQGMYDFASTVNSVKTGQVHLDYADFVSNTKIRESPGKGRGLFATKDIHRGEIVMVERAFCLPDLYTSDQDQGDGELGMWNFNTNSKTRRPAQAPLFIDLLRKVSEDEGEAKRFFDLDGGGYIRTGKEGEVVDGAVVVDSFLVEATRLLNTFSCPRLSLDLLNPKTSFNSSSSALSTGLWVHAAYINHSCTPNAIRSFLGSIMVIRSTRFVSKGEEILHQYRASNAKFLKRKEIFEQNWGFTCSCRLCTAESKSSRERHEERARLVDKLKKEVMRSGGNGTGVSMARIKSVEKLTRKLDMLHEPEIYDGIPRLLLIHPCIWLMERYRERGEWEMIVRYAGDVLRNFGFVGGLINASRLGLNYEKGIMNTEAMRALTAMCEGHRKLGERV